MPTFRQAQAHVALVRAHTDLAHAIASELAEHPQEFHGPKIKRALKLYAEQRRKIEAFEKPAVRPA